MVSRCDSTNSDSRRDGSCAAVERPEERTDFAAGNAASGNETAG